MNLLPIYRKWLLLYRLFPVSHETSSSPRTILNCAFPPNGSGFSNFCSLVPRCPCASVGIALASFRAEISLAAGLHPGSYINRFPGKCGSFFCSVFPGMRTTGGGMICDKHLNRISSCIERHALCSRPTSMSWLVHFFGVEAEATHSARFPVNALYAVEYGLVNLV